MRNDTWLKKKLDQIWQQYFADVRRLNEIEIKFGAKARRRLGSIRQINPRDKNSATKILITGFFKDETVPEIIVEAVIAHELCHYAHGFASPLPQFSKYPHQGGIVDKELKNRGLEEHLKFQKTWLKTDWPKIIGKTSVRRHHSTRRRKISLIRIFGLN